MIHDTALLLFCWSYPESHYSIQSPVYNPETSIIPSRFLPIVDVYCDSTFTSPKFHENVTFAVQTVRLRRCKLIAWSKSICRYSVFLRQTHGNVFRVHLYTLERKTPKFAYFYVQTKHVCDSGIFDPGCSCILRMGESRFFCAHRGVPTLFFRDVCVGVPTDLLECQKKSLPVRNSPYRVK